MIGYLRVQVRCRSTIKTSLGNAVPEAFNTGTDTLTARIDGQVYACKIKVTAPVISKSALSLKVGRKAEISLKKKIRKAEVVWFSDNPDIARVEGGKIVGVSAGEAVIYTETGGIRNECKVTVK